MDTDTKGLCADACLVWHLFTECPVCNEEIDLADVDADVDYVYSSAIFYNQWDDLIGEEVDCPKCKAIFTIESVQY